MMIITVCVNQSLNCYLRMDYQKMRFVLARMCSESFFLSSFSPNLFMIKDTEDIEMDFFYDYEMGLSPCRIYHGAVRSFVAEMWSILN